MATTYKDDEPSIIGVPATLHPGDIAMMFEYADNESFNRARRMFYRQVNLNPLKRKDPGLANLIRFAFEEWFAFDYMLEDTGRTPYSVTAEFAAEIKAEITERHIRDFEEIDESNFAAWFWITEANAAKSTVTLEDMVRGGTYTVYQPYLAHKYDGARGGSVVCRIAHARDVWVAGGLIYYEARRPDSRDVHDDLFDSFHAWKPLFPDLIRLLFGRDPNSGMDWAEMDEFKQRYGIDALCDKVLGPSAGITVQPDDAP